MACQQPHPGHCTRNHILHREFARKNLYWGTLTFMRTIYGLSTHFPLIPDSLLLLGFLSLSSHLCESSVCDYYFCNREMLRLNFALKPPTWTLSCSLWLLKREGKNTLHALLCIGTFTQIFQGWVLALRFWNTICRFQVWLLDQRKI